MNDTERLAPCPDKPNCVCTTATDPRHAIAPIPLIEQIGHDGSSTLSRVAAIVESTGGSIVERREGYLRAEYRSRLFRFVDDVEFVVDIASETLHFRSASRTGVSDLGVNRRRMEQFRKLYST
jgi:uncharacterized protein (DUF1499 family)